MPNDATVQEISLEIGGTSAESPNGGLRTTIIPKDGGNIFRGSFFTFYTDHHLQGENLTDELRARHRLGAPEHAWSIGQLVIE